MDSMPCFWPVAPQQYRVGLAALLMLGASGPGCRQLSPPPPAVATATAPLRFEDVTAAAGLQDAGGETCAWADYNGDGYVDLMAGKGLFRNCGNGTFTPVPTGPKGEGIWADFDNDGRLDFLSLDGAGGLYQNLGGDQFEAAPLPPNPHPTRPRAAGADVNRDGFVDVYITTYESSFGGPIYPSLFYLATGNGKFADPISWTGKTAWAARGANWADFDNDGDQDLYISNYRLMPNQLWVNDGTGSFADQAKARGVYGVATAGKEPASAWYPEYEYTGHTIGSCWGDVNNDGNLDLVVVNFAHPPEWQNRTQIQLNSGPPNYTFTNVNEGNKAGIYWQESYAKAALGDYDNDGDLDLYITAVYPADRGELFANDGHGTFTPVGDATHLRTANSYQVSWADYDNDGDLDLFAANRLYRNPGNSHRWLKLTVRGGNGSNTAAIGARVRVTAGDRVQIREVCGGNSGNQDPLTLHFGLGDYSGKVKAEVFYPSGKYHAYTLKPCQTYTLTERDARHRRAR
jgi:hypothetical protein